MGDHGCDRPVTILWKWDSATKMSEITSLGYGLTAKRFQTFFNYHLQIYVLNVVTLVKLSLYIFKYYLLMR